MLLNNILLCMYHLFSIISSPYRSQGMIHILATVNNIVNSLFVQMPFWYADIKFLYYILEEEWLGHIVVLFWVLGNHHAMLFSIITNSHSHQSQTFPFLHLFASIHYYILVIIILIRTRSAFTLPSEVEIFPHNMLVLWNFSLWEMTAHILCSFILDFLLLKY